MSWEDVKGMEDNPSGLNPTEASSRVHCDRIMLYQSFLQIISFFLNSANYKPISRIRHQLSNIGHLQSCFMMNSPPENDFIFFTILSTLNHQCVQLVRISRSTEQYSWTIHSPSSLTASLSQWIEKYQSITDSFALILKFSFPREINT